ncbi:MAG TPA: hypothetical protein VMQ67_08360, partial [Candidatus Saccharimonadales bacterium]|nr:hypothetical protein [Candidatus Saccharimonadales bacterium]
IQARRDIQCQLMSPWPGRQISVHEVGKAEPLPFQLDKSNGECLVFLALAGHSYSIESEYFEMPASLICQIMQGLYIHQD